MGLRERMTGGRGSPPQRISDHDRGRAIRELTVFHERGLIDDAELAQRVEQVRLASTAAEVERCFADLRDGRRGWRETRITDEQRDAALRALSLHHAAGRMRPGEHEQRRRLVIDATVADEVDAALAELPALKPARTARGERLASDAARAEAEEQLIREQLAGRLTAQEYARRAAVVREARTGAEIDSAFAGLRSRRAEQSVATAGRVGRGIVRGGLLVTRVLLTLGWAAFVVVVLVAWQVTGVGAAPPLLVIGVATVVLLAIRPRR